MNRLIARVRQATLTPLRRRFAHARVRGRPLTARWPALPNLVVVSTQRCGTSSLHRDLGAHPDIFSSVRKEVDYFSRYFARGEGWYRAHFPFQIRIESVRSEGSDVVTFGAMPGFLLHPTAALRASQVVPNAKILVLLRAPTSRAYSHFEHRRRLDFEKLPLEDALEAESNRLGGDSDERGDDLDDRRAFSGYWYVARGTHVHQLERWMSFFPRDCFMVVRRDDTFADPGSVFADILRLLELRSWRPAQSLNHSYPSRLGSKNPDMDPRIWERLVESLVPHNARLAELVGRDVDWPRPGPLAAGPAMESH